ncbi:hypothetical protein G5I_03929 [Acromyrmex echinatior]|uniref:Uncharacterized protein n=1 Tax=Acromyrmex echinatior TaxID=103372 RepID=F4WE97_ACREC|nr:hypothetical protein G5I_03929 [Acromyrmex echinatior]
MQTSRGPMFLQLCSFRVSRPLVQSDGSYLRDNVSKELKSHQRAAPAVGIRETIIFDGWPRKATIAHVTDAMSSAQFACQDWYHRRSSIAIQSSALSSASNSGINSYWIVSYSRLAALWRLHSEIRAVTLHASTSQVSFKHRVNPQAFIVKLADCAGQRVRKAKNEWDITIGIVIHALLQMLACVCDLYILKKNELGVFA